MGPEKQAASSRPQESFSGLEKLLESRCTDGVVLAKPSMVSRVGAAGRQGGCDVKSSHSTMYLLHCLPHLPPPPSQERSLESHSRNPCLHGPCSDSAIKGPWHARWQTVAGVSAWWLCVSSCTSMHTSSSDLRDTRVSMSNSQFLIVKMS